MMLNMVYHKIFVAVLFYDNACICTMDKMKINNSFIIISSVIMSKCDFNSITSMKDKGFWIISTTILHLHHFKPKESSLH